jgi:hypothetical protein
MAKDKSEKKAKKEKDVDVSMDIVEDLEIIVADERKVSSGFSALRALFADLDLTIYSHQRRRRRKERKLLSLWKICPR